MKKKTVIFGTTEFSTMMKSYLVRDGYDVVAFCRDRIFMDGMTEIERVPIIAWEDVWEKYKPKEFNVLMTIGYGEMNGIRARKCKEVMAKGYQLQTYIHPSTIITNADIGDGCILLEGTIISNETMIGIGNIFHVGATVAHNVNIGNFNFFAPASTVAGDVSIGNNCFFGINCTVRNSIKIEDQTLIGAGCYIDHDTNIGDAYVPCKSIKLKQKSQDVQILTYKNEVRRH